MIPAGLGPGPVGGPGGLCQCRARACASAAARVEPRQTVAASWMKQHLSTLLMMSDVFVLKVLKLRRFPSKRGKSLVALSAPSTSDRMLD
eukprot:2331686-Rhodomonas_salina.1